VIEEGVPPRQPTAPTAMPRQEWKPDDSATGCNGCGQNFNAFRWRHHCRRCGELFCGNCTTATHEFSSSDGAGGVEILRVCVPCKANLMHGGRGGGR